MQLGSPDVTYKCSAMSPEKTSGVNLIGSVGGRGCGSGRLGGRREVRCGDGAPLPTREGSGSGLETFI